MNPSADRKTVRLVTLGILLALVIILQFWGSGIRLGPTSFSLVLIPIALGGMLLGPGAGALLGFAFGLITLLCGIFGLDAFTQTLLQYQPVITALLCLGKGTAAGWGAGMIYRAFSKKNDLVASFLASAAAPVINTGLFALGALLLRPTIESNFVAEGVNFFYFLFIGIIGLNFVVEFSVNLILATVLCRIVRIAEKKIFGQA